MKVLENNKRKTVNSMDILVKDLKISDARNRIKFTRVHRLGGRAPNRSRPVIVKFHYFKDK